MIASSIGCGPWYFPTICAFAAARLLLVVMAQPSTIVTPIERAVPSIILAAASRSVGVQVLDLLLCDGPHLARVIVPTFLVFGSPEPFSTPAASMISTEAGEDLISNSNDRSA